jgi:acetyltransferase-like isoleucine patch superfamily enzyme
MFRQLLQIIAFFLPPPLNVWTHRIAGAKIGRHVSIHPGVLILAQKVEIGSEAKIKLGTMIYVRTFKFGRKSLIGFFTLARGDSDLIIGDRCTIGPKNMIRCDREVILGNYTGIGAGCYLYTHGCFLPVTEGYRATFGPIQIKDKAWISMRGTIGPGVTVEEGTMVMPGTVLIESISSKRLVAGNPAKLSNIPAFLVPTNPKYIEKLAHEILQKFCDWSNEYKDTNWRVINEILHVGYKRRNVLVSVNNEGDIVLFTEPGKNRNDMYFNLTDLKTDQNRHPIKLELEAFMRLYYGLTFL